jgi:HAD superfamily hydrolase (TIGR01509 family)
MRPVRAVLCGVEDVLLRLPQPVGDGSWERRLGLTQDTLQDDIRRAPAAWRATIGLATDADVWMELACLYRLHADEVRALAGDFAASWELDTELAHFLHDLRPCRKIALVSNAWPGAQANYRACGLDAIADAILISAEVGLAKPDTRIYELAAERLDLAPEECLFVDACPNHVAGARDAGLQAILFESREQIIVAICAALDASDR